ncbi:hypothetical protein [Sporosarcina sp. ACRSL]|uniref:hypothetical protein n=1 Tax=Sporosarcina sp. ACRSL TaxID=2918215 RepID=UPI001EF514DE|nr:hypothetical protein [Sporosarcina sp. ACRSL]
MKTIDEYYMDQIALLIITDILIKIGILILGSYIVLNILRLLAMKKRDDEYMKGIRDELDKIRNELEKSNKD